MSASTEAVEPCPRRQHFSERGLPLRQPPAERPYFKTNLSGTWPPRPGSPAFWALFFSASFSGLFNRLRSSPRGDKLSTRRLLHAALRRLRIERRSVISTKFVTPGVTIYVVSSLAAQRFDAVICHAKKNLHAHEL